MDMFKQARPIGRHSLWLSLLYVAAAAWSNLALAWPETEFSRHVTKQNRGLLAPQLKAQGFEWGAPAFIRLFKESQELELWLKKGERYRLFKTYNICGLSGELGPKQAEGDLQAPEGFYFVSQERLNPWSSYHLSMNMGYPNAYDSAHQRTGSALMIHGTCLSLGCFAIGDDSIEELYSLINASLKKQGGVVRVHAFPFRLTPQRLKQERDSQWYGFWNNLKTGYDWFERRKVPPDTTVKNKRYVFGPIE